MDSTTTARRLIDFMVNDATSSSHGTSPRLFDVEGNGDVDMRQDSPPSTSSLARYLVSRYSRIAPNSPQMGTEATSDPRRGPLSDFFSQLMTNYRYTSTAPLDSDELFAPRADLSAAAGESTSASGAALNDSASRAPLNPRSNTSSDIPVDLSRIMNEDEQAWAGPRLVEGSIISELLDNFACTVCFATAVNPRLCPKCAKFFCRNCLQQTYRSSPGGRRCPHCRANLTLEEYVRVSWASELSGKLESVQSTDKCPQHGQKQLCNFCVDCQVTICVDCWTETHQDHKISPLEAVYNRVHAKVSEAVGPLKEKRAQLVTLLQPLRTDMKHLNQVKTEAERMMKDMMRDMHASFYNSLHSVDIPKEFNFLRSCIDRLDKNIDAMNSAISNKAMNRIVDKREALENVHALSETEESNMEKIKNCYKPAKLDPLQFLKGWTPVWDIREKVFIRDCKRTFYESKKSRPRRIVAKFEVNDIIWSVGTVSLEDEVEIEFPDSLRIFVVMNGRPSLKDYEFAIESLHESDSVSPPRHSVIRRDSFQENEEIFFALENPKSWVNEKRDMSFNVMIRPLTYRQKSLDQAVYIQKLVDERTARNNAANRADNCPVRTSLSESLEAVSSSAGNSKSAQSGRLPWTENEKEKVETRSFRRKIRRLE